MVMKPEELAKLKMKSSYDDAINEWQIPILLLKAQEVALSSLSKEECLEIYGKLKCKVFSKSISQVSTQPAKPVLQLTQLVDLVQN